MKVTITVEKEVDIKTIHVSAGVRYWEDTSVNGVEDTRGDLIPCRNGDNWEPIINLDKGQITNWKQGVTADIHYKVCDAGLYEIKDAEGNTVLKKEGYVPDLMSPEDEGFGDYIIMKVDENGFIGNWSKDVSDMLKEFEG